MANGLYAAAKEAMLTGGVNLSSGTVTALLIDAGGYTVSLSTHANLSDIPSLARVGTPQVLAGKSVLGGVFDANDITFPSVATGAGSLSVLEAFVLYIDTGVEATSKLIAYFDTATGLPATPGGGDIQVTWSNGSAKIFAL